MMGYITHWFIKKIIEEGKIQDDRKLKYKKRIFKQLIIK